jgi:hypothetical protein
LQADGGLSVPFLDKKLTFQKDVNSWEFSQLRGKKISCDQGLRGFNCGLTAADKWLTRSERFEPESGSCLVSTGNR